jgi:hypothetical protein
MDRDGPFAAIFYFFESAPMSPYRDGPEKEDFSATAKMALWVGIGDFGDLARK